MISTKITTNAPTVLNRISDFFRISKGHDHYVQLAGDKIMGYIQAGFNKSESPYGLKWPRIWNRIGKPLVDTGKLRSGITMNINGNKISVSSPHVGAKTHNEGMTIRVKKAKYMVFTMMGEIVLSKQVVVPKRQFLPAQRFPPIWEQGISAETNNRIKRLSV